MISPTGESQPSRKLPACAFQISKPRVGTMVKRHRAIVHLDDLNAFLASAMQGLELDAPGRAAFGPVGGGDLPLRRGKIGAGIGQDLGRVFRRGRLGA